MKIEWSVLPDEKKYWPIELKNDTHDLCIAVREVRSICEKLLEKVTRPEEPDTTPETRTDLYAELIALRELEKAVRGTGRGMGYEVGAALDALDKLRAQ